MDEIVKVCKEVCMLSGLKHIIPTSIIVKFQTKCFVITTLY